MIRHIVLLRFEASVTDAMRAEFKADLDGLQAHLDGILDFQFGVNVSPEAAVVHGFADGFWFDFEDEAARDAYLVDPAHKTVGARLVEHTQGGTDGLVVFDIEI